MTPPGAGQAPRVLCVGVITLDHLYSVTTALTPGIKHRADGRVDIGGGIAANSAVAVARLGGRAALLGAVGTDTTGDQVLAELQGDGVDIGATLRLDGLATTEAVVLIEPGGDRTIVAHAEIDLTTLEAPELPVGDERGQIDAVLVDGRWPAATEAALAFARSAGIPAVVDVDRAPLTPGERSVLLDLASHLVCSEVGLAEMTGAGDADEGLRRLAAETDACVAVTAGAAGVTWLDASGRRHLPAFTVDVVDTTGAGDVFHGAAALALAEGRTEADAFRFASAVAGIKCSRPGGRAGIPTRAEVDAFLADHP